MYLLEKIEKNSGLILFYKWNVNLASMMTYTLASLMVWLLSIFKFARRRFLYCKNYPFQQVVYAAWRRQNPDIVATSKGDLRDEIR